MKVNEKVINKRFYCKQAAVKTLISVTLILIES